MSILLGIFAGQWVDGRLHSSPLFMIVGLLLGLASGLTSTFRMAGRFGKKPPE